jgi:hypothetical protein
MSEATPQPQGLPTKLPGAGAAVLHRVPGGAACAQPANRGQLPRRDDAVPRVCDRAPGQDADEPAADGHHAGVGPEVPGPPGTRAAQLGAQPQPAADGTAGVPEVRRPPRRERRCTPSNR